MTNIAIIPARMGSKRLKRKNIKLFFGKPVIYYSIEAAKKSKLFSKIIVSTDSLKIAKISKSYGAEVSDLRPKNLSNSVATTMDVINYEANKLKEKKIKVKNICCIYPVAPLTSSTLIKKLYLLIKDNKYNFTFPVCIVKKNSNYNNYFHLSKKNLIKKIFKNKNNILSYKNTYRDSGQLYWGKFSSWKQRKILFSSKTYAMPIADYMGIDVNTKNDWSNLKINFKKMKNA